MATMRAMRTHIARLAAAFLACVSGLVSAQPSGVWTPTPVTTGFNAVAAGPSGRAQLASRMHFDRPQRSDDGGLTWREFTVDGGLASYFWASPSQEGLVYAFVGPLSRDSPGSLHRTLDGGATWQRIGALNRPNGPAIGLLAPGATPDLLYGASLAGECAGEFCGILGVEALVSDDGGRTWRSIEAGVASLGRRLVPAASDANTVYLLTYEEVYASSNRGRDWRPVLRDPEISRSGEIAVDRRDARLLYARTRTRLRVSENGGTTWRDATLPDVGTSVGGAQGGAETRLVADPIERGRLYIASLAGRIYESRDMGATWKRLTHDYLTVSGVQQESRLLVRPEGTARHFTNNNGTWRVRVDDGAFVLGAGMWWNPAESGSGFSITQHPSGQAFIVWYHYDRNGAPTWVYVPGGTWIDARTFRGTIYRATGAGRPGGDYVRSAFYSAAVGTATFRFSDDSTARFEYRFDDGLQGATNLVRQRFAPVQAENFTTPTHADLWWNPGQPGWGLAVDQQWGRYFATLFFYDDRGNPTWTFMSDVGPSGEGIMYIANGSPIGQPYDASRFTPRRHGFGRLELEPGGSGTSESRLVISAEGFNEQIVIERQPF